LPTSGRNYIKVQMKICVINNLYFPWNKGGAEQLCFNLVTTLIHNGHEVQIITTQPKFFNSIEITSSPILRVGGLSGLLYNLGKFPKPIRLLWHVATNLNLFTAITVNRFLQKYQPELVISHNLIGLGLGLPLVIKRNKIRQIHVLHDIQLLHPSGLLMWQNEGLLNSFLAKRYQQFTRYCFKSIDVVVSPSAWLVTLHQKYGLFARTKKEVLPNPIEFKKNNSIVHVVHQPLRCLFVGQLEAHKGIDWLVKVLQNKSLFHLTIIGPAGSDGDKIDYAVKNSNNIAYLGRLDRVGVSKQINQADVLIVPSFCYENYPTVIIEAITLGLPVLASRLGGIPEMLPEKNLFNPGNADELLKKLQTIKSLNEDLIVEKNSVEEYCQKILAAS